MKTYVCLNAKTLVFKAHYKKRTSPFLYSIDFNRKNKQPSNFNPSAHLLDDLTKR